jgi:uncharacterized protein (TIGR00369 family)
MQSRCFVCGQDNPSGLKVGFRRLGDGEVVAGWSPGPAWEGFSGIVHGGVLSAVLDEAMSKAVISSGAEALTAELRVRYVLPVRSGTTVEVRGWVVNRDRRLIETEAAITGANGSEYAHAWGRFLALPI